MKILIFVPKAFVQEIFTRTSPAGHGGTEGIGMGTVFCNVLTKPNNFLKI